MKVSKEKLKQIIKEEFDMLKEEQPYTTDDLQNLLNNVGSGYKVQIIVNGQPVEIDEVWIGEETLNISVR